MAHPEPLALIRKYGVPLDPSDLKNAHGDEEQGRLLDEWTKSHITRDTLLTKDELNAYNLAQRSGRTETLQAATNLSTVLALRDQDLQDAIHELTRSTEAINRQTDALRQQHDALSRLIASSGKNGDLRANLEAKRTHKWESDQKALNTAVELLSQGLDYRMSELEQQSKGVDGDATRIVDEMLRSDDKLLSSLQKLGWELDTEDPEETESVTKLREICARLIKYTVECIRTKLDRLYLNALEASLKSGSSDKASKEEVSALQDELESLYSEILPVAQMSVEQQHLEPSLRSLSAKNGSSLNRSAEALNYVLNCFDFLLDKTGRISSRFSTLKAHEAAVATIIASTKDELSTTVTSPIKRRGTGPSMSSPSRRPRSLIMDNLITPAPSRTAAKSRRRSSGDALYDSPLEQLLGELALDLPEGNEASASNAASQVNYLSAVLSERAEKSASVTQNAQSTFENTAISHLADARIALQLIRDSVLAESPFAEVHLVDPGIESSIGVLAQEIHNVDTRLEGVEREAAALAKGRNVKREEIVARWGRRI